MCTTFDLPDELFRDLKLKSAREGVTLKQLIVGALESHIRDVQVRKPRRIRGPLIRCKSKKPIALTNAKIEALLTWHQCLACRRRRRPHPSRRSDGLVRHRRSGGGRFLPHLTQMGFLRLLPNAHAMHEDVRSQREAWCVFDKLRDDERVTYLAEPEGLERKRRAGTQQPMPSNHLWTNCCLRAFAEERKAIVVTFDRTFARSTGVQPLLLGRPR
jgi:predicted nucleic acid-binding protein